MHIIQEILFPQNAVLLPPMYPEFSRRHEKGTAKMLAQAPWDDEITWLGSGHTDAQPWRDGNQRRAGETQGNDVQTLAYTDGVRRASSSSSVWGLDKA